MRNFLTSLIMICLFASASGQSLQPFILGADNAKSISEMKGLVKEQLKKNGIDVLGEYQPAGDKKRWLIVFSSPDLIKAVKSQGELTGFAAALRLALTVEGGKTLVTYTNPPYWGHAYFRESFEKVESHYKNLTSRLAEAMKGCGNTIGKPFGSEEGIEINDLHDYSYMFLMPEFDDTNELKIFDSYQDAVTSIDAKLKAGVANVEKVYSIEIPGKELKLYGVGLSGEEGEGDFLPTIDISTPKHTAFLPYEFLVMGNEVHMLHGRFRIAISFPDLTMGTFTKIMSTPGNIEDLLLSIVE